MIWATRLEEEAVYSRTRPKGGKGGVGASKASTDVSYRYHANVAIGLCEGPIAFVRRIWADGKPFDMTGATVRVHRGLEDQDPDPLIVAKQGAGGAPAYRGLAYVVFERLPSRISATACRSSPSRWRGQCMDSAGASGPSTSSPRRGTCL